MVKCRLSVEQSSRNELGNLEAMNFQFMQVDSSPYDYAVACLHTIPPRCFAKCKWSQSFASDYPPDNNEYQRRYFVRFAKFIHRLFIIRNQVFLFDHFPIYYRYYYYLYLHKAKKNDFLSICFHF